MALALNTAHALYGNLLALICVDDDNTVKDLRGNQTCTKDAACTIQSSTGYGRAFRTTFSSGDARGVSLSPGVALGVSAPRSVFIVTNTINSLSGWRYMAINVMHTGDGWSPSVSDSYAPRLVTTGGGTIAGTSAVNSGGHSWGGAADRNGDAAKVFADGVTVAAGNASQSGYGSSTLQTYIGGETSGGYGGVAADYVWVAFFDKYLTDAEISALHASLGADNTFALIASANAAPTFPGPSIGNQTGTVGATLSSNDVSAKFSDTDTLTFSAVGTWPPGVTVSSAGVISGTPTTAGTYSGLSVRATDTAAQTVDSDTFNFTIGAAAATASGTPDTLDLIAPSATAVGTGSANGSASGSPSVASITAPAATATGTTSGSGIITTPALKNNTGTILASISGWTVNVYNASTGALVVQKTGLTTSAGGVLTVTDAAIATGTTYAYEPVHAIYGRRLPTGASS